MMVECSKIFQELLCEGLLSGRGMKMEGQNGIIMHARLTVQQIGGSCPTNRRQWIQPQAPRYLLVLTDTSFPLRPEGLRTLL